MLHGRVEHHHPCVLLDFGDRYICAGHDAERACRVGQVAQARATQRRVDEARADCLWPLQENPLNAIYTICQSPHQPFYPFMMHVLPFNNYRRRRRGAGAADDTAAAGGGGGGGGGGASAAAIAGNSGVLALEQVEHLERVLCVDVKRTELEARPNEGMGVSWRQNTQSRRRSRRKRVEKSKPERFEESKSSKANTSAIHADGGVVGKEPNGEAFGGLAIGGKAFAEGRGIAMAVCSETQRNPVGCAAERREKRSHGQRHGRWAVSAGNYSRGRLQAEESQS